MKKRNIALMSAAVALSVAAIPAYSQASLSPYTTTVVKSISQKDDIGKALSASLYKVNGETYISAYIHVDDGFDISTLTSMGVKVGTVAGNIVTAKVPVAVIDELSATDGIRYVDAGRAVKPMMDIARDACGVDDVHAGTDLSGSFDGEGVVIGIIDMGFEYDHANFYDSDLTDLRIKRIWEQDWTGGSSPSAYGYGGEITTTDDMLYYLGDVTSTSHGTHVAGIAAGAYSADGSSYYGVAPGADLVFVSMGEDTENNVNISDAVAYIYDYADSVGKPCVVNMSIGTQIGPHDGTSSFDQLCDALQGEGRLLVGSVGNFGDYDCHVSQTFASSDDSPLQTLIEYIDDVDEGGEIDIWGDEGMELTVQVFIYDKYSGTKKDSIEIVASDADGNSTTYTWESNAVGSVTITSEVNPLNNKPHAYIYLDITQFKSRSCAGICIKPQSAGTVHAWADATYVLFTDDDEEGMTDGNTDYTIAEIGGTGTNIISVGAYITRDYVWSESSSEQTSLGETLGELGSFSSHGPTIDGRLKPYITAPGGAIVSSLSNNDEDIDDQYIVKTITFNDASQYFGLMQGTSMSAPFVTGVLATWLQANPELTPDEAKEIIKTTAIQNDYTGEIGDDGDYGWGYGIIDAYNGIKECIAASAIKGVKATTAPAVALMWSGSGDCKVMFTASQSNVTIELTAVDGTVISRTNVDKVSAADELTVAVPAAGNGIYLLNVTADGLQKTYKIAAK